ncbi:MAG: alpha/beta hydrolase [bacterium]|nr:alpha/beta hydrolase [bacterium]
MKAYYVKISVLLISAILLLFVGGFGDTVKSHDGIPLAYDVQGKGDTALVFVHCWCCNRSFWENQVPHFVKKYKVVTLDLAGHGDSGKNRDKWTIQAYAQDVAVVINELKLKKVVLIGHSMGGSVCVEAAGLMSGKVAGVIAVDTLQNVEQKVTKEQFQAFTAAMRKDFVTGTRNFLEMYMFVPQTPAAVKKRTISTMTSAPSEVGLQSMESLFFMDLAGAVKKAGVDIRCINSDKFPNNIEAGKRHAKSFEVKYIKEVGHFPHMEKPAEFNGLMDEWLKDLLK